MSSSDHVQKEKEEHYLKSHKVFRQKAGEVQQIINSLRPNLPLALKRILNEPRSKDGINILSVGSGNGDIDIEILKIVNEEIQRKRPSDAVKMFNRAIEPHLRSLDHYKNTITTCLPKELSDASIVFDIDSPQTFEEYMENVKETVEFDIIHFIHSIYHITDVEKALKYCYEKRLGNNGAIVLILGGKHDSLKNMSGISQLGEEVVDISRKHGWHHEVYSQKFFLDVTEVFDKESIEGNLLLDFIARSLHCKEFSERYKDFRANNEPERVELLLQRIKEVSIFEDGKFLAKKHNDMHIIFK